jgi:hypothetical protein
MRDLRRPVPPGQCAAASPDRFHHPADVKTAGSLYFSNIK